MVVISCGRIRACVKGSVRALGREPWVSIRQKLGLTQVTSPLIRQITNDHLSIVPRTFIDHGVSTGSAQDVLRKEQTK